MKKILIAIAFILSASFSANAGIFTGENVNDENFFTFDVRLGCNFSNVYAQLNNGSRGKIGGFKAGFSGTANCRFYPAEMIAIESGLGVQQRGSKDWTIEEYNNGAQYTTWYLELPLLASVRVVNFHNEHSGFLEAGVYGGYGFDGKITTKSIDSKGIHEYEQPIFGDSGIMIRGDFGLILGASAIIAENYIVTFRYQQSFIPLGKGEVANYGKFYNNGFSIRFGILL